MIGKLTAAAVAAVALAAATPASAACEFQLLAEAPVTMDGLRPTVPVKINGQDTTLIVDSGAFFSTVSAEAAAKYGLKPSIVPFGLRLRGVGGGEEDARAARAQDFTFASATFHNIQFLVGGRIDAAGLLGENILGAFDTEYDLANGMIRFFKADGCRDANLAYWSAGKPFSRLSLNSPSPILLQVRSTAKVDGHTIRVLFDTGSPISYLSRPAAARDGITPGTAGVTADGLTYGLYGKGIETSVAPFASFAIGDEEIKNTRLRIADIELDDADMLIGADFFLSHRILVSKSQHKLYFTYNGGPVFRLDRAAAQQARADESPAPQASSPDAKPPAGAPTTAAEFNRRGAASMSRRDFPAAIADFTRAIELEPADGGHYRSRANARLGNRQPVLAMADLDQALKIKPGDVQALMTRGELHLGSRDMAGARADFEAAMTLAPEDHFLPLRVGGAYTNAGLYEPALREFDSWIAAHPKDGDLAQVLNARCWTRAAWGKELDLALADCDAAMKQGGKLSPVMDSRGLVLLRLGRLDEAITQYDAAIRLQPKAAWALYGRGLAKLKKGLKAEGDADIQAATSIQPDLPQEARRYGLQAAEAPAAGKS